MNITRKGLRISLLPERYWIGAGKRTPLEPSSIHGLMDYQITIRHGKKTQRYLTLSITAPDAAAALRSAADEIPEAVIPEVDLVELRPAPDFEKRFPDPEAP